MVEKLIVAVCGHPVLYDTTAVFYRDKFEKEEPWVKVSEELVFRHFWDLYNRYSAATVVTSAMIDVEREQVEKYRPKNEQASASSFFP